MNNNLVSTDDKISHAEIVEIFGEQMPIEALSILFASGDEMTVDTKRERLRELATLSSTDGDDGELLREWQRLEDAFHDALPNQGECGDPAPGKALCQFLYDNSEVIRNRIPSLNAQLERMREALEPFADKVEYVDWLEADDDDYIDSAPFKAGDYRKARAASTSTRTVDDDD